MENKAPLMIWIGSREDAMDQLTAIFDAGGVSEENRTVIKFAPNIRKLELQNAEKVKAAQAEALANAPKEAPTGAGGAAKSFAPRPSVPAPVAGFSIKDIKL